MAGLSRAVAEALVHGPGAGLAAFEQLSGSGLPTDAHRLTAVRAHLLERAGNREEAIEAYLPAARATPSIPEFDYLIRRAHKLGQRSPQW